MICNVALHRSDEGYSVTVPGLPGCCSQGATEAEALENIADAIREFRVVVSLEPANPADAHFDLARALEASGNKVEAKREVLRSLEIAPSFEKAQELLLKLRGEGEQ